MSPEDFLKELSKYEIDVRRPSHYRRDVLTMVLVFIALGLGVYVIFRGGPDLDVVGGGILVLAAVAGAARSGRDVVLSEGPGKGTDPDDKGSDTTVITLGEKPKEQDP